MGLCTKVLAAKNGDATSWTRMEEKANTTSKVPDRGNVQSQGSLFLQK
jgi:hypothetical protein